jgi:hypothetical protein
MAVNQNFYAGIDAASILGASSSKGEFQRIADRLSSLAKRVADLENALRSAADRAFGPQPECADEHACKSHHDGELGIIHSHIDQLEGAIAAADREATRLCRL